MRMAYQQRQPIYAAEIMALCLPYCPEDFYLVSNIFSFYCQAREFEKALEFAAMFISYSKVTDLQLYGHYLKFYALLQSSNWNEAQSVIITYKQLLNQLIIEQPNNLSPVVRDSLNIVHQLFYFEDNLPEIRRLHNEVGILFQRNLVARLDWKNKPQIKHQKKLKIGYIANTLRNHFGKESQLRRQVHQKLRQSRASSPLWNGYQFTKEMEQAYQQMWENF